MTGTQVSTTFEVPYEFIQLVVDSSNVSGGNGGSVGDTVIAIQPEAEGKTLTADEITRLTRDTLGRQPGDVGYSGGMLISWAGKTHQIVDYTPGGVSTEATITISNTDIHNLTAQATGIAQAFTEDTILRAGLQENSTAEITVSISLCRATGHDFTQIGTGGFNQSNYPNVILGAPEGSLAPYHTDSPNATTAQVWERRKGRVFWMSTDQYGFFRVGKFFEVDQGQGSIKFSGEIGITGATALGFKKGVTIDEFSIDDTMADESDSKVPVEKAIVSYINKRLGRDKNDNLVAGLGTVPGFLTLTGSTECKATC